MKLAGRDKLWPCVRDVESRARTLSADERLREPERARVSQSEPECASVSQRESQSEPERARLSQREQSAEVH